MPVRELAGGLLRRIGPRTVRSLEAVPVLERRLEETEAALAGLREQLHERSRHVEALERSLREVEAGLEESRRLSLRVAQMTDLVFDRLLDAPGAARPPAG
jgi:chromosome segregation ATPase